jgi:hypothetical protein
MKTTGVKHEVVEVDICPKTFLIDLFKSEFGGFDLYNAFKVDGEKLYVLVDTSYHGSPNFEERLLFEDKAKVEKYKHLIELIKLY